MGERSSIEPRGVASTHRPHGVPSNEKATFGWSDTFVWTAFLVAFSPVLFDLADLSRQQPWTAWSLVIPVLIPLLARRDSSPPLPNRDGYVLLGFALLLEGFAIAGGPIRWGRPALPLGVFGLARILGRPSIRVSALACWSVPIPWTVVRRASPLLEYIWLRLAAATLSPFAPIIVQRASAIWPGGVLNLEPPDGGLPLVTFLSGIGWIYAVRNWSGWARALITAALWGFAGLLVQALTVTLALALALSDRSGAARACLSWGVFVVCTALALVLASRNFRVARG